jgi:Transposase DDE domain
MKTQSSKPARERTSYKYDQWRDTYRCRTGRLLYRHHFNGHRGYYDYRTRPGVCGCCRLAPHCTRSKAGRSLNRYPDHHLLERARRQSHGPAAQRDRQRRQWLQERNFAEATTQHGFKRARWRGLLKQTIQDQLIATLQNLKILLRKGRLGFLALLGFLPQRLRRLIFSSSNLPPFRPALFA